MPTAAENKMNYITLEGVSNVAELKEHQTEYSKEKIKPDLNYTLMFIFRCIVSIALTIVAGILTYQNARHWWIFLIVLVSIPYYSNQRST